MIPVKSCDKVLTAMVRAVWGPTLQPNNVTRIVATTVALMVPLHRAAPEVASLYRAILTVAHVQAKVPDVVSTLWEFRELRFF